MKSSKSSKNHVEVWPSADDFSTKSKDQQSNSATPAKKSTKTSKHSSELQSSTDIKPVKNTTASSSVHDFSAKQSPSTISDKQPVIIGYVHNLSPTKRNRGNTMSYCSLTLQTSGDQSRQALLYSPAKRSLLLQSQTTHTPVKIRNYTHTEDKEKLVINDITNISTPEKHEYNFQYGDVATQELEPRNILQILNSNKEWDAVAVRAKILSVKPVKTVGMKHLNIMEALIGDHSGTITLDVWESHIAEIHVGQVYLLNNVQVRVWASKKKLSTTYTTTITSIEEPTLQELQQDVAGNEEQKVIQVNKIETVQKLEKFLRCIQCNRRILQGSCSAVVRCDNCNSMMRAEECRKSLTAKLVILQPNGQELSITVNDNVLSHFFEVDDRHYSYL